MTEVFIIDGARTAFGSFGGGLKDATSHQLGVAAAKAALERSGIDASKVDNVVMGNVIQAHEGAPYLARHVALDAGVPIESPALTLNRLCGSGLQAVVSATQSIKLGESEVGLAGGAENMSQAPYVSRKARFGIRMGDDKLVDTLSEALTDNRAGCGMGLTAENLAEKYGITREDQDAFAATSHQRATRATESGRLEEEIVPVTVETRKGPVEIDKDEHIREGATQEGLSKLKPVFKKDNGRELVGHKRRRRDGNRCLGEGGRGGGPRADGPRLELGGNRRRSGHNGHRSCPILAPRPKAGRTLFRRCGPNRDQRGLRRPVPRMRGGARAGPREGER